MQLKADRRQVLGSVLQGDSLSQSHLQTFDRGIAMKFSAAIAQLLIHAEICENNAPINEAEGNFEQAELERSNAKSYRAAIASLEVE